MAFLDRWDQFNRAVSLRIQWIGLVGLLVMMAVTTIDVFLAKTFLNPIRGALDLVELAQLIAISLAGAATLLHGKHVEVDFVMIMLPERVQIVVGLFVKTVCLCLFGLLVLRFAMHGHYLQDGGEVSGTARIPLFPFVYAAALGILPMALIYLKEVIDSIRRLSGKWNP